MNQLLHPSGLKLFGSVLDVQHVKLGLKVHDADLGEGVDQEGTDIGIEIVSSVVGSKSKVQLSGSKLTVIHTAKEAATSHKMGRRLMSLEKDKFNYLPNQHNWLDVANMIGVNSGYWDTYPNTPSTVFDQYTFEDFNDRPYIKTNIMPDVVIYVKLRGNNVLLPPPKTLTLAGNNPQATTT